MYVSCRLGLFSNVCSFFFQKWFVVKVYLLHIGLCGNGNRIKCHIGFGFFHFPSKLGNTKLADFTHIDLHNDILQAEFYLMLCCNLLAQSISFPRIFLCLQLIYIFSLSSTHLAQLHLCQLPSTHTHRHN